MTKDSWKHDRLFVSGEWTASSAAGVLDVLDPATEDVIGLVPDCDAKTAEAAIKAARKAFDEGPWPRMSPRERGAALSRLAAILDERHDALKELVMAETGSTGFLCDFVQVRATIDIARWIGESVEHVVRWTEVSAPRGGPNGMTGNAVVREPAGVVAAITPFNFPFFLNIVKSIPALAAGCTVVLKPHPWTPLDAFELARAAQDAELPPGVLNVITGGAEIGEELTTHPMVDMVTFTGSTADRPADHGRGRADGEAPPARAGRQERVDRAGRRARGLRQDHGRHGEHDSRGPGLCPADPRAATRAHARRLRRGS